ncbi:MAG: hypothetical protein R3E82_08445 [Pseudomonadales bacterium]|nr:hypothetical protein [Pseudomonadales bacterium]
MRLTTALILALMTGTTLAQEPRPVAGYSDWQGARQTGIRGDSLESAHRYQGGNLSERSVDIGIEMDFTAEGHDWFRQPGEPGDATRRSGFDTGFQRQGYRR